MSPSHFRSLSFQAAVVALILMLAGALPQSALAAQKGISPDLAAVRSQIAEGELIPVAIVLQEQAEIDRLLPLARQMDRTSRRAFAKRELSGLAERTQAGLLDMLQDEEARGRAADLRSLWLGNTIAARVAPEILDAIAARPEVRVILWDPLIPPEEANDIVESSSGAEVPQAGESPRSTPAWNIEKVRAPEAWGLGINGEGVVVAILDSGIDCYHPDLSNRIWTNPGEINGNGIDDDENGYVDDVWGWDFVSNDNTPWPNVSTEYHGTLCAGNVAGDGTQGTITGVAPGASLMSCKVSSWSQNIEGIQYAIDNGADVISMSRSEKWRFTPKPDYDWWRDNTDAELLAGIFHANSIGNEGDNLGTDPIPFNIAAPGNCPSPWLHPDQVQAGVSGIIGCGATDANDNLGYFSSLGPAAWEDFQLHWSSYPHDVRPEYQDYPWWGDLPGLLKPDVVAPGYNCVSTDYPGEGYTSFSGTSSSTPHIAGAMALIAQANPDLSAEQMSMVLQTTALDLGAPGKDTGFGAGRIDCYEAVVAAQAISAHGTVRGYVYIAAGSESPIADALVEVLGTEISTVTSPAGYYQVELEAGDYTLRVSHPEFLPAELPVSIDLGETVTLDVYLEPGAASVEDGSALRLALDRNRPNPFHPRTTVRFTLPAAGEASVVIFDPQGRRIRTLATGLLEAGAHAIEWDGRDATGNVVPTGVYLCRLSALGETRTRPMVMLR